jgi:hypothetical protein
MQPCKCMFESTDSVWCIWSQDDWWTFSNRMRLKLCWPLLVYVNRLFSGIFSNIMTGGCRPNWDPLGVRGLGVLQVCWGFNSPMGGLQKSLYISQTHDQTNLGFEHKKRRSCEGSSTEVSGVKFYRARRSYWGSLEPPQRLVINWLGSELYLTWPWMALEVVT